MVKNENTKKVVCKLHITFLVLKEFDESLGFFCNITQTINKIFFFTVEVYTLTTFTVSCAIRFWAGTVLLITASHVITSVVL